MGPSKRQSRRPGVAVLLGLLVLGLAGSVAPAPAAADGPGFTVTMTPTRVTDGQRVIIDVTASPGFFVLQVEVAQCRGGVEYQAGTEGDLAPPEDFGQESRGNCPIQALSTSTGRTNSVGANFPSGAVQTESLGYQVGSGTIKFGPDQTTLACDPENACVVVVEGRVRRTDEPTAKATWRPFVQPLTFVNDDPFAGCGGPATGILGTAGPDRMSDTWINWTIAECQGEARQGAATRITLGDEREQVVRFAQGQLDIAYTAGGYDDEMGLCRPWGKVAGCPEPADRRPAVAVPIAINASVLAVAGGRVVDGRAAPFADLKLTVDEMAGMMTGLALESSSFPPMPAIMARNAELDPARGGVPFYTADPKLKIGALATAQASTWYQTRYLKELVPEAWKVPDLPQFNANKGLPRGADLALGTSEPPYDANVMSLFSGRPSLVKVLAEIGNTGGAWVFTDAATAKALALVPVKVQDATRADGVFIAPTPETMAAAVPTMKRDGDGVLISDPMAVAAAGQPPLYPMTFVEYALVPAQPLLSADCKLREGSQTLLKGWLDYITGPAGQAALSPGMVPLTESLRTDAAAAIAKVGKSEVTGNCGGRVQPASGAATTTTSSVPVATTTAVTIAPTTVPAPEPAAPSGTGSGGSRTGASTALASGAAAPAAAVAPTPAPAPAQVALDVAPAQAVVKADVPPFAGKAATAFLGVVLSIVGIMAVSSLFAVPSLSGWLPWRKPPPTPSAGYRLPPGPE